MPILVRTVLFALALVAGATALAASFDETPFLAENDAAMAKMMTAMPIKPSGDVDNVQRRYLVIVQGSADRHGPPVQIHAD